MIFAYLGGLVDALQRFRDEAAKYNELKAQLDIQEKVATVAAYEALRAGLVTKKQALAIYDISAPALNRRLDPVERERGRITVRPNQYTK